MFKTLLTNAIQEQKNENEETILQSVKKWWNTTRKTYDDVDRFLNGKTTIKRYTFHVSSGHQANIFAKKNHESIHILSAGEPDSPKDFKDEVIRQLAL